MSDEQTIYISPEDDLTTVRERLEQISARRLTMVIPPQTQLRSYVAWKLLHARARELSKEVVIVSSDPQVRSVAHAVKFKVAHSLESSPATGKSRPASRSGRTSSSGGARSRTSSSLSPRSSTAKASRELRSEQSQHKASSTQPPQMRTPEPEPEWHEDPQHRQQYDFGIQPPPTIHPLSDQIEEPDLLLEDYTQAQDIRSAAREGQKHFTETDVMPETRPEEALPSSQQPHTADDLFTHTQDSRPPQTEPTGAISLENFNTNEHMIQDLKDVEGEPSNSQHLEGVEYAPDHSPNLEDVEYAPDHSPNLEDVEYVPDHSPNLEDVEYAHDHSPNLEDVEYVPDHSPNLEDVEYVPDHSPNLEDVEYVPDHSPNLEDVEYVPDHSPNLEDVEYVPDHSPNLEDVEYVPDHSPNLEDVEYVPESAIEFRGDRDDIVPPPSSKPITYSEAEQASHHEEQDEYPSRTYGVNSRRRRSSNLPPTPPMPPMPPATPAWQFEEDALPPVEERQIQPRPSTPIQPRTPGTRSSGKIPPGTKTSPISRTSAGRGQQPLKRSTTRPTQQHSRPSTTRPRAGVKQQPLRGKNRRKIPVAAVIAILLLFVACLLIYYGPTANIIIGITTRDYSRQVTLTAKTANQTQGSQSQQFSTAEISVNNFSKSGTGTATGSQLVGTNPAQGTVIFTYNGTDPDGIVIPSGSIVTTSGDNPIEFATTAEVLVPQNKVSPPVSVQAVKPGEDGNVDAGVITVIPSNTLNNIAQTQSPPIAASDLKLSVVNSTSMTGGGAKSTPAVTDQDLTKVKNDLHQQLQSEIKAWQQQLSSIGAVGTPQTTDTLINAPKVNDIETTGTFSATIKVTATALLVRTADLQKGAIKQLSDSIKNDKSYAGDAIFTDINPAVTITQVKQTAADTNSITFTFNATAKAGPRLITKAYIQQLIVGKSIPDARAALINIPGVKTADIIISPSFISWITFWTGHIDVTIRPATIPH